MENPLHRPKGGALNSSGRESFGLTSKQITNMIGAAEHAGRIGLPLNRMVTIHWEQAGIMLAEMTRATGKFFDLLSKHWTRHGFRIAYIWVHENGAGKGGHCHVLLHAPAEIVPSITPKMKKWICRVSGRTYKKNTVYSRPIGPKLGVEKSQILVWLANLEQAVGYVVKGGSDDAIQDHGLDRVEAGGFIIGKRCGVSQNISDKARRKHAKPVLLAEWPDDNNSGLAKW